MAVRRSMLMMPGWRSLAGVYAAPIKNSCAAWGMPKLPFGVRQTLDTLHPTTAGSSYGTGQEPFSTSSLLPVVCGSRPAGTVPILVQKLL